MKRGKQSDLKERDAYKHNVLIKILDVKRIINKYIKKYSKNDQECRDFLLEHKRFELVWERNNIVMYIQQTSKNFFFRNVCKVDVMRQNHWK